MVKLTLIDVDPKTDMMFTTIDVNLNAHTNTTDNTTTATAININKDLVIGIAAGILNKEITEDLKVCLPDDTKIKADIESAIKSIKTDGLNGLIPAGMDIGDALFTLVSVVNGDCPAQVQDSLDLVDNLTVILDALSNKDLVSELIAKIKKNKFDVIIDISKAAEDWEKKDMLATGTDVGKLIYTLFLLPVTPVVPVEFVEYYGDIAGFVPEIKDTNVLNFIEGLADGIVNANIEQPLELCLKDVEMTLSDLGSAIDLFEKEDKSSIEAGLKELSQT